MFPPSPQSALPDATQHQAARERLRAMMAHPWRRLLRERGWVALLMMVLGAMGTASYVGNQPKVYESSTTIEYDLTSAREPSDAAYLATREFIRTQNHILTSRSMAERVVSKLRLDDAAPRIFSGQNGRASFEETVTILKNAVRVSPVVGTRAVTLRARAASPNEAARIANTFVECYREKSREDRALDSSRALAWLRDQQTELKRELDASERAVVHFREQHEAVISFEEHRKVIADQYRSYTQALTELRIKRVQVQARLAALKDAVAAPSAPSAHHHRATASDPVTAALRQGAKAELAELEQAELGLGKLLADLRDQSVTLDQQQLQYAGLERERAAQNERYRKVLERSAQADLASALQANTVHVIERARPVANAVEPRVARAACMGGVAGLLVGMLLAAGLSRRTARSERGQISTSKGWPTLY